MGHEALTLAVPPTATAIIRATAARHEVDVADMMGPRKDRHLAAARHACWVALREQIGPSGREAYTFVRIASWFDTTHSTVAKAVRGAA